jgi:hypothetical protein
MQKTNHDAAEGVEEASEVGVEEVEEEGADRMMRRHDGLRSKATPTR